MQNISSISGLKDAIKSLEADQAAKGKLLKEQFYLIYDSFQPARLLNGTLSHIASSPYLIDNILGTALGLASGFLSKKIIIGYSGNKLRRLIGTVLQVGVTNVIAQNSDKIKLFSRSFFQNIFRKKIIFKGQ